MTWFLYTFLPAALAGVAIVLATAAILAVTVFGDAPQLRGIFQ